MSLPKLAEELYQLFDKSQYAECQRLLPAVKLELIKHNLLVPLVANTGNLDQINDLKIAERILEIGALSALLTNDNGAFERFFASLAPFYGSRKLHAQPEINTDTTKIISLNLVYLLSQGLISDFHVHLETIFNSPQYNIEKDKYLAFPVLLERNLMEGNYIKIWKLLQNEEALPCGEYRHFTATLINTLRHEIAKSIEHTNDCIPVSNCKTLLYFPQESSNKAFEEALRTDLDVSSWVFHDDVIYFNNGRANAAVAQDNGAIIANVLNYADQIESIV